MRRGRPAKGIQKLLPACTSLPPTEYDELCQVARGRRIKLSELLRELIVEGISQMKKYGQPNSLLR